MSGAPRPARGRSAQDNYYPSPNNAYNIPLQEISYRANAPPAHPIVDNITSDTHYESGNKSYRTAGGKRTPEKRKRQDSNGDTTDLERGFGRKKYRPLSDDTLTSLGSTKGLSSSSGMRLKPTEVVSLLSSDEEEPVGRSKTSSKEYTKVKTMPVVGSYIQNGMERTGATLSTRTSYDGQESLVLSSRDLGPPPNPRKTPIPPPPMPSLGPLAELKAKNPLAHGHLSLQAEQGTTVPKKWRKDKKSTDMRAIDIQVISSSSPPSSPLSPQSQAIPTPRKARKSQKPTASETPDAQTQPPAEKICSKSVEDPRTSDIVPLTEPVLCQEQADLVELIVSGRNVFYTGSAGCGKSTVLKAFNKRLSEMGKKVDVVAPTGRAALDINGSTTWTYAGWTPDSHKKPLKELKAAAHGKFVRKRLGDTDVLVIDEISMVENLHFERLNWVMKEARNDQRAFGGVQLVVTGDFCQLPPVKPFQHCMQCGRELKPNIAQTVYKCAQHGEFYDIDKWAFRSAAWKECGFIHVNLTNIHRQSDAVFINILQKCRLGTRLTPADTDLLLNHHSETRNSVKLFSTREEVRRINQENFNKLRSRAREFLCLDDFKWNENHRHLQSKSLRSVDGSLTALRDHRFETRIHLKKGMLVVLLVNLDISAGLVNGSQGVIQGFENYDPKNLPKATENSRKGKDKDAIVAAPVPTLGGDHAAFREDQIKAFINRAEHKEWPIVTFNNGVTRTIYADCTVNEVGDDKPYSLLSRTQIPLTAAWAMSIHKSQGMTLNRVVVDLSKSFEEGQMYVALSRAKSLEGLKVEGLGRGLLGGNEQVKEFLWEKFGIK